MSSRKIPDDVRNAAVEDYKTSGDTYAVVAARHGISKSRLNALVRGPGAKRKPKTWGADEIGLTGGRWINVRGIQRWESFIQSVDDDYLSDHRRRVLAEEEMFTDDEARDAHARYAYGCREPRTVIGERVYNRRKKRAQVARKRAA